jgi:thiosulfate/3-mercaptopyruvate sulfurtransferase
VFDARESKLYEAGHIPKAKNLALASLLTTSGTKKWLPKAEILQRLRAAGYVEGKPVVTYCTTGREGSMLAFTLKHVAGIKNVRLYDGSMLDWRARNLPIEKGTGSLVFGRRSEQTKAIR